MYLERTLDTLSKENPQNVFIPLSPFHEDTQSYFEAEQIDNALMSRYMGKKAFRVGAEERVVYEKVSGLKRTSVAQSMIYNFSSEGAFTDF